LRIERRAVNHRRNNKEEKGKAIVPGGPKSLTPTLQLGRTLFGGQAKSSSNAGDYVCNYSMYVVLEDIKRKSSNTRFGFIHIPHDYPLERAFRLIRRAVRRLDRV
jgi:pyrrolidone-carboxylate peptidase